MLSSSSNHQEVPSPWHGRSYEKRTQRIQLSSQGNWRSTGPFVWHRQWIILHERVPISNWLSGNLTCSMGIPEEHADPWASLRPPPGGGGVHVLPPDVGSHGAHRQRPQPASCCCRLRQRLRRQRRRPSGGGQQAPQLPTAKRQTRPGDPAQSLVQPHCSASNTTKTILWSWYLTTSPSTLQHFAVTGLLGYIFRWSILPQTEGIIPQVLNGLSLI